MAAAASSTIPTSITNGALPCAGHHTMCHEGGWILSRRPDGTITKHAHVDTSLFGRVLFLDAALHLDPLLNGGILLSVFGYMLFIQPWMAAVAFKSTGGR